MTKNRIIGSVLALALGDALGAPYEGGLLERALWALLGRSHGKRRWTDDTRMSIDIIESLSALGRIDRDDLAKRFARSYRWSRGYGPGAAKILRRIRRGEPWEEASRSLYPQGSYGNGGAMRAPVVGLFFCNDDESVLIKAASASAMVTHAHALGQEGAVLIALATALALKDRDSLEIIDQLSESIKSPEFSGKLKIAGEWLQEQGNLTPKSVAAGLGNGIAALDSCVTAIYIALACKKNSFEELLAFVIQLGGDVDTIASMACAIWGAMRGMEALPEARLSELEQYDRIMGLARSFADSIAERFTAREEGVEFSRKSM